MAAALAGDPEIIIMDEPTAGLDPKQIVEIRSLIRRLGETHTVILSSHILHEVSDVCEDIIIIHQGRIIRQSPLNELIASENEQSAVSVRFRGDEAAVCGAIRDMEAVRQVQKAACPEPDAVEIRVVAQAGADIRAPLWDCLKRTDASVLMMKREEAGLEEVFLKLIGAGKEV